MSEPENKGWGWLRNAKKVHYFIDGRSLCGKWLYFGPVTQGNDSSPDNCVACRKALEKLCAANA